jgi:signal transduction histidine kinase
MVASTFARYPYPESFFVWQSDATARGILFLNRSDRRPAWMDPQVTRNKFPVVVESQPTVGRQLIDRIMQDAAKGYRLSAFDQQLGGAAYQVVAYISYTDVFRERVTWITGFTVNIAWVREHYFAELIRQVASTGGEAGGELSAAVTDDQGARVVGSPVLDRGLLTQRRQFPLMFFDPALIALHLPSDLPPLRWTIEVSAADDPTLAQAVRGFNQTLLISAIAALSLVAGLLLTARAERTSAKLAELRSDFVSTVTHELKTPIATIRAAAETLAQGRLRGLGAVGEYGRLIVVEAKRLTRLVENLLAHARITDIADVYDFEPIDLAALFENIHQEFRMQLSDLGFDVSLTLPPSLPRVMGDELSLRLLFDNLIDNAIRYSDTRRWIHVTAHADNQSVRVDISDRGIGIAPDEVAMVTRKFVRGRHAPRGGSGLGLAIASRVAADHRGTLTLHSIVGEGTTASVRLPVAKPI